MDSKTIVKLNDRYDDRVITKTKESEYNVLRKVTNFISNLSWTIKFDSSKVLVQDKDGIPLEDMNTAKVENKRVLRTYYKFKEFKKDFGQPELHLLNQVEKYIKESISSRVTSSIELLRDLAPRGAKLNTENTISFTKKN